MPSGSKCEGLNLKPSTVLPVQEELANVPLNDSGAKTSMEAERLLLSLQGSELSQVISHVLQVRSALWETIFTSARAGKSASAGLKIFADYSILKANQATEVDQAQHAQQLEVPDKQDQQYILDARCPTGIPPISDATSKANGKAIDCVTIDSPVPKSSQISDPPIIQFSTAFYYCQESEQEMIIDVMRLGDLQRTCSVKYETCDASALAGKAYEKTSNVLIFQPGEIMKEIKVPILQDDSWDATLEFEVLLSEPVDAELGRYLYTCRAKIIDDDAFPTNRFAGELLSGYIDKIPEFALLWEYFKMNYSLPIVRRGCNKTFVIDQLNSLYFILRLFLTRHLFNNVIDTDTSTENLIFISGHRDLELVVIMIFIIVPFAFLHYLDVYKCTNKVGGTCRTHIQENLLRKYLNYDEESRSKVRDSDLVVAMTRDTIEAVHTGYAKIFPFAKNVGKLFFVLLYQTIPPLIRGELPNPLVMVPILVFPGFMWIFLKLRMRKTIEVAHVADQTQNEIVRHVGETVSKYRLIADYNRRPYFVDRCTEKCKAFNKAVVINAMTHVNNKYFAPWLSIVAVGVYTIYGGLQVIDGGLEMGDFLVNLAIFKAIGVALSKIFGVLLDMQSSLAAVKRIVTFMNLEVDVKRRMQLNRQRRKFGRKVAKSMSQRLSLDAKDTSGGDSSPASNSREAIDAMPLKVDVKYKFSKAFDGLAVSCVIQQGNFVAVVGQHSKGKSTMLKLLAGVLIPDSGMFIPPHLRVLHVSERPLFISGTLKQNLLFGVRKNDEDGNLERVLEICQMLLLPPKIVDLIKSEECMAWGDILSLTEKASLNLARALIANPEILCIHKPTVSFDDRAALNTIALLRRYVKEKGLAQDPAKFGNRRPRTCIITTTRPAGIEVADQVFMVDGMSGVREIDKTKADLTMLNVTAGAASKEEFALEHNVGDDTSNEVVAAQVKSSTPVGNDEAKKNAANAPAPLPAPEPIAAPAPAPAGNDKAKKVSTSKASGAVFPGSPIIQFSTAIYYCTELEGKMVIDVTRLGQPKAKCSAKYETRDSSAKAGKKYHHTTGTVHFAPGEMMKEVCIPLINDDSWDSTLEFEVVLSEPQDAILGRYLYTCRAKVVDDDFFPTNRFGKRIASGELDQIPLSELLLEYFKANYSQGNLRNGTKKQLAVEQFQNLYFIARLFLTQYLINQVLNTEVDADSLMLFPGRRDLVLVSIMLMIVTPFTLVHGLDVIKNKFGVGGGSRVWIQQNLLRKFLNYDEESRCVVKDSDLVMAMTRDTLDLTGNGYGKLFPLVKNLGMLCFILLYQIIAPLSEGQNPNPVVVAPVLVFPALMIVFLKLRNPMTIEAFRNVNTTQNELVEHVGETVSKYRLIADYNHRPHIVDLFSVKIGKFNKAWVAAAKVKTTNRYLPKWVSTLVVGFYTIYGGLRVINRSVDLGDFIVNLEIFQEIGEAWTVIYIILLDMQSTFPALRKIVRYMNLQVDVQKRMELNRQRRNDGLFAQAEARNKFYSSTNAADGSSTYFRYAIDTVPIQVGVSWMFAKGSQKIHASCTIQQGKFVALVGHSCSGKSTMLKLLGGVLLPESGLFIPPHLRVLHVSEVPLFFEGTLRQNLCFGVDDSDDDGSSERVIKICQMLLLPDKIISCISSTEIKPWGEILSVTEKILLSLARAFILNPEVLLMHKPSLAFDDNTANNTIALLQRFVKEKGLVQDPSQISLRRPRTCIITAGRPAGVEVADQVLLVDNNRGVQEIPKSSVTEEMLKHSAGDLGTVTSLKKSTVKGLRKVSSTLAQKTKQKTQDNFVLPIDSGGGEKPSTDPREAEVPLLE